MGCDIHMFIEYRNTGMAWKADPHHKPIVEDTCISRCDNKKDYCDFCSADRPEECDMAHRHYNQTIAIGRDYRLFSLLAGIREPKGLPADVSEIVQAAADRDGQDGHSHSYMSLEEFKKVLFEECISDGGYKPTTRTDIFYKWEDYSRDNYNERPPDYSSIVAYCEQLKEQNNVEKYLLDNESLNDVEVRLVFWFDN
jgi:hypothetical protein